MPHRIALCLTVFVLAALPVMAQDAPPAEMDGMPLVFQDDFDGGTARWEMTDAQAWKIEDEGGNPVLAAVAASKYEPEVRSPKMIAWVTDLNVSDFVLEVRGKQTGREYGHRDLCFFFGKQDASHFYYVHLATKADEHANSIFLVNGAPRVSIAKERTSGTDWGSEAWHTIRIRRTCADGRIEVFFDDMTKPVMVAEDKTFTSGTIGLGSFDDVGRFDAVRVWGKKPVSGAAGETAAPK